MLDGLLDVTVFGVGLSELLVSLHLLALLLNLLAESQELVEELNGLLKVAKLLVDVTDLLVALGLLLPILSPLRCIKALLEESQSIVKVVVILEVQGDDLIHSNELLAHLLLQLVQVAVHGLLQGGLEAAHGVEDVEHLLLADAEAHVGSGLALNELSLDGDILAFLVEVRGRFIIVKLLKLLSHLSVLLQAVLDLALSVELLGGDQFVAESQQRLFVLLELVLLPLVELVLLLQLLRWLDLAWSRVSGDVEEVHVSLKVTFLHELDGLGSGCNLLLQFEIIVLFLEVSAGTCHVLLVLVKPVAERLLAVFLDDCSLSFLNKFLLLLDLRLFLDLPDLSVGVIDWCQLHLY